VHLDRICNIILTTSETFPNSKVVVEHTIAFFLIDQFVIYEYTLFHTIQSNNFILVKELNEFIAEWQQKARLFDELSYGDKYIMADAPKDVHRVIKRYDDKGRDDAQRTLTSLRNVDKTVPISILVWEKEYE